jgi:hypothetical protein
LNVEVLVPASPVISGLAAKAVREVSGPVREAVRRVSAAFAPLGFARRDPALAMVTPDGARRHVPLITVALSAADLAEIAAAVVPAERAEDRGALERLSALLSVDPAVTEGLRRIVRRQQPEYTLWQEGEREYERAALALALLLGGDDLAPYARRVDGVGTARPRMRITSRKLPATGGLLVEESHELLVAGMSAGRVWRWCARHAHRSGWASTGPAGAKGDFPQRQVAERAQIEAFLAEPLWIALAMTARDCEGVTPHEW